MTEPHGTGAVPSGGDPRDIPAVAVFGAGELPRRFSGTPATIASEQGATERCVGFSGAKYRTITEFAELKRILEFDGDELWRACQAANGNSNPNPRTDGTSIRTALDILLKRGAKAGSMLMPIAAYTRLYTDADIKASIQDTGAAWAATAWYRNWFSVPTSGRMPAPSGAPVGFHAWLQVGWDDDVVARPGTRGAWRVQNQYGTDWADHGRAWMAYVDFRGAFVEAWRTVDLNETEDMMPPIKTLPEFGSLVKVSKGHPVEDGAGRPLTRYGSSNPSRVFWVGPDDRVAFPVTVAGHPAVGYLRKQPAASGLTFSIEPPAPGTTPPAPPPPPDPAPIVNATLDGLLATLPAALATAVTSAIEAARPKPAGGTP